MTHVAASGSREGYGAEGHCALLTGRGGACGCPRSPGRGLTGLARVLQRHIHLLACRWHTNDE